MTEYLEKTKVMRILERILECLQNEGDKYGAAAVDSLLFEIGELPAAKVVEDVQAYWRGIEGDGYAEDEDGNPQIVYEVFECSNCGKEHHADGEPEWDYCPDCGARMDGGESNG